MERSAELVTYETLQAITFLTVALVFVVFWFSRTWITTEIRCWQEAAARFKHDFPELQAETGLVSRDARTALLKVSDSGASKLGVVTVFGDQLVTRLLDTPTTNVDLSNDGLFIDLQEITFPSLNVSLSPQQAKEWQGIFVNSAGRV